MKSLNNSLTLLLLLSSLLPATASALTPEPQDPGLKALIQSTYSMSRDRDDNGGVSELRTFKLSRGESIPAALEALLAKAYAKAETFAEDGAYDLYGSLVLACQGLGVSGTDRIARADCTQRILRQTSRAVTAGTLSALRQTGHPQAHRLVQILNQYERDARKSVSIGTQAIPNVETSVGLIFTRDQVIALTSDHGA